MPYAPRPALADVASHRTGGRLTVTGTVVNAESRPLFVPRLRVAVYGTRWVEAIRDARLPFVQVPALSAVPFELTVDCPYTPGETVAVTFAG